MDSDSFLANICETLGLDVRLFEKSVYDQGLVSPYLTVIPRNGSS